MRVLFSILFLSAVAIAQTCGPPNYACPGRAVINDNCILQIYGGGPSSGTGCPATDTSIPNLSNGSSIGASTSAVDPQFGVLMTRITDGELNGTITTGTFLNRSYNIGAGGSGDTNAFTTDSSMVAVFDSGNRFIIETLDTVNHTSYPIYNGASLFLPGAGEFSSKTKGNYFSFFPGSAYTVSLYSISCTNPGKSSVSCTGLTSPTVKADFSTIQPQVTATAWAASTSYTFGQYVYSYLTNSQSATVTAASCASNVITYTTGGLSTAEAGGLMTVSGLSSFNGTALPITSANGPGTSITSATTCTNGSISGQSGTMTEGSNVLFQDVTSGTHSSGSSNPFTTSSAAALTNTTDSGVTWMASGTTNWNQGGGWTTIGGVSVDETQFSGGASNNNFDSTANGALGIKMNGNQNTGFYTWTYDSTADIYYEWNNGSGIAKSFACTASSGPQCTRGVAGITVLGAISPASTTQCTNTSPFGANVCQFYLHNVKTLKGGTWNEITNEYCASNSSGPGNCPSTSKYDWSKGTTTVNMNLVSNSGHETERFTTIANFPGNGSQVGVLRVVTASNTIATFWSNANINQIDGHFGWYYLNGSTSDSTMTPMGGTTFTVEFPYTQPFENELVIVPSCGSASPVVTPACSGTELQANQVRRVGHCWATFANNQFNPEFCIPAYSQDGTIMGISTDYACQFGSTTGGTLYCGFPWSASWSYNNSTIQPTSGNAGGFVYSETGACTSGATSPSTWNQTGGGTTTEGSGTPCVWTNQGVGNGRGDVVFTWLNTNAIAVPAPALGLFAVAGYPDLVSWWRQ
jgi:hypothetical protein